MPPDPITHERIYRALREEYLDGRFQPGHRLDLHALADRHRASTTPVREAMHRMIGEQLFEPNPEGGVRLSCPSAPALAQLYVWNAQQLLGALRLASVSHLRLAVRRMRERSPAKNAADHVWFTGMIFQAIGEATGNIEFTNQIDRANARLHYVRLAEADLFEDLARELRTFLRNGEIDVRTNLRRRIIAYHRRRIERVTMIADQLLSAQFT